ncbi:Fructose-1,6-bisphosphatase, chloroplastic [Tetrabaena socialis]|uniref:fructose-bisphosphatase n=1 Tax=Tetrabaena socialis TaxID=47790 RepID=A0A2J8A5R2_9CHLO|nr:Fructose-1,6-bisphosphatase, chloroplastic [Tetrabaena socialis]|eukprot:PNH07866.1 Fructose-1,6-bisphosphatase, chloroplastic [Tetrabaena socialis]
MVVLDLLREQFIKSNVVNPVVRPGMGGGGTGRGLAAMPKPWPQELVHGNGSDGAPTLAISAGGSGYSCRSGAADSHPAAAATAAANAHASDHSLQRGQRRAVGAPCEAVRGKNGRRGTRRPENATGPVSVASSWAITQRISGQTGVAAKASRRGVVAVRATAQPRSAAGVVAAAAAAASAAAARRSVVAQAAAVSAPAKPAAKSNQYEIFTLTTWLLKEEMKGNIDGELATVIASVALACKQIASLVSRSGISNLTGAAGLTNVQGEDQKKLDVVSNEVFKNCLASCGRTGVIASEEEDQPVAVEETYSGNYICVFDPLDGSSNIDAGISVGSIFGIYEPSEECPLDAIDDPVKMMAGGLGSTGQMRVMDVDPEKVHQRVPLFIGSKKEVEYLESFTKAK